MERVLSVGGDANTLGSSRARQALWAGVIGAPLFVLVGFVDGFIHPDYNPVTDFWSEMSRGQLGWLQTANFLVDGALLLAFAAGIRWGARRGPGSAAGAALFAVIGLGNVVSGLFTIDAHTSTVQTLSGTIHMAAAPPVFFGLVATCFVFARRFRGGLRAYSVVSGIVLLLSIFAFLALGAPLDITGILQRVAIVVGWQWITVLAVALRAEPVTTKS